MGGGGVDGAIHRAARGRHCWTPVNSSRQQQGWRCQTGQHAVITPAGKLSAKAVIHAVRGRLAGGEHLPEAGRLLEEAYRNCLATLCRGGRRSIAFRQSVRRL